MKTQIQSLIATIVYEHYTENVDMNNEGFKQSELNALIKNDKDIVRVDYYINNVMVGNIMYTGKQAMSQIVKMDATASKISGNMEHEHGKDWFNRIERNNTRRRKISELETKIAFYKQFITEKDYNACDYDFCCTYEQFIG